MSKNIADIKYIKTHALVIGSGCAGLNCADTLYNLGHTDVKIVTEGLNMGTSRNTGSDKQTYYKLSTTGKNDDSVYKMAQSLFEGIGVNGDTALCEAASSLKCFMKLALLGVDFPTNEYGEYVGYRTDHTDCLRATSAGPLTSKYMTEALEREVKRKNIEIYDSTVIFELIVKDGKVFGAIGINKSETDKEKLSLYVFVSPNIVVCTGGNASIYKRSVYPLSQTGMSGMVLKAGAKSANLEEWQYGIASVDFRWNLSGTYQQVMPRYFSVDDDGNEYDFLYDELKDKSDSVNLVFKKGYEWPFDVKKRNTSSMIDILIYNETVKKKRKVYMDFTKEPTVLKDGFDCISEEARDYLLNSDALIKTPINRLKKMNPKAIKLYKDHNIDLTKEPLRIDVCAQHNNGGIGVDKNYQTNIDGLYVAGEAAGTFGVYRPGGSALNSTQVGSMRASEHIAQIKRENFDIDLCKKYANKVLDTLLSHTDKKANCDILKIKDYFNENFDSYCAFLRDKEKIAEIIEELENFTDNVKVTNEDLYKYLKLKDMFICMIHIAKAMLYTANKLGQRGGSMVFGEREKEGFDDIIIVTEQLNSTVTVYDQKVRPIPNSEQWFEKVWNKRENREM